MNLLLKCLSAFALISIIILVAYTIIKPHHEIDSGLKEKISELEKKNKELNDKLTKVISEKQSEDLEKKTKLVIEDKPIKKDLDNSKPINPQEPNKGENVIDPKKPNNDEGNENRKNEKVEIKKLVKLKEGKDEDIQKEPVKLEIKQPEAPPEPIEIREKITILKDDPIQPKYVAINQPEYIQQIRQVGKTYNSIATGKVSGRAAKADWGIKGSAYFQYIYGMEVISKVLSNDGMMIVEERKFSKVTESVLVSDIVIGFYFGKRLRSSLQLFGFLVPEARVVTGGLLMVDGLEVPVDQSWIDRAKEYKIFENFPDIDPKNIKNHFKAFKQVDGKLPLEGKTFEIVVIDGQGVESIKPLDCGISEEERELIIRSNQLMDHYIFPNQKKEPGDSWEVDGNVLGGLLDHRMSGTLSGKIKIERAPDFFAEKGDTNIKLKMVEGFVKIIEPQQGNTVNGKIQIKSGIAILPKKLNIITNVSIQGSAEYNKISTNHLLFEARMDVNPDFEARYECEVK